MDGCQLNVKDFDQDRMLSERRQALLYPDNIAVITMLTHALTEKRGDKTDSIEVEIEFSTFSHTFVVKYPQTLALGECAMVYFERDEKHFMVRVRPAGEKSMRGQTINVCNVEYFGQWHLYLTEKIEMEAMEMEDWPIAEAKLVLQNGDVYFEYFEVHDQAIVNGQSIRLTFCNPENDTREFTPE